MIYFLALLPATALTIGGYLVLYVSGRSEGGLRTFGKYLGFWAFTLAGLVILGALFAAAHGRHHHRMFHPDGAYGRMHGAWPGEPPSFRPGAPEQASPGGPGQPAAAPSPPPPASSTGASPGGTPPKQ